MRCTRDQLERQAHELRPLADVHCETTDVGDSAAVDSAFARAVRTLTPVSILINNSGQAASASFVKTDGAAWDQIAAGQTVNGRNGKITPLLVKLMLNLKMVCAAGSHAQDLYGACRARVSQLGVAGWLGYAVAGTAYGARNEVIGTRSIIGSTRPGLQSCHADLGHFSYLSGRCRPGVRPACARRRAW